MLPISSTSVPALEPQAIPPVPANSPAAQADAVAPLEPPPTPASVLDLSPVGQFLSSVSQARQQLNQLQAAVANGAAPPEPAEQLARLTDVAQNLVTAFNLLPAVDFNQRQPQAASLLNNLVQSLAQQSGAANATPGLTAGQDLARIGVTLQAPLLSDAAGGLSLDSQALRAAFNTDQQAATATLQRTVATFRDVAVRFAEQASATALASSQQAALTAEQLAAQARLDAVRAELEQQAHHPLPATGADRLAAQRATEAQLATTPAATPAGTLSANPPLAPAQRPATPIPQGATAANTQAGAAPPSTAQDHAAQAATQAASAAAAAEAKAQRASADLDAANAVRAQAAAQAALAQSAAADLAAANAAAAAAAQQARAAQAAAAEAAMQQALAVQEALNQANANLPPAGPADALRSNPALAGAIAANNINDTARAAAAGRAAPPAANAVRPVQRVTAVGPVDADQTPPA